MSIDFASKAFGGNAQESIASLKSTRDSLISVLNQLTEPLAAFNELRENLGRLRPSWIAI